MKATVSVLLVSAVLVVIGAALSWLAGVLGPMGQSIGTMATAYYAGAGAIIFVVVLVAVLQARNG